MHVDVQLEQNLKCRSSHNRKENQTVPKSSDASLTWRETKSHPGSRPQHLPFYAITFEQVISLKISIQMGVPVFPHAKHCTSKRNVENTTETKYAHVM
jgi:hypothetical protein